MWSLVIETDCGLTVTLHNSMAEAEAKLFKFVEYWWPSQEAMPPNQSEAIDRYFEVMGDRRGESYDIQEVELPAVSAEEIK